MVIGMDVGTTFTAVLASIGGSTAMRQTGYGHVIYNVLTGVMAFALVGLYTSAVMPLLPEGDGGSAQVALVAFHSMFNTLGVILVLPFTGPFARFISRVVPERGPVLTDKLDDRLTSDPHAAVDAAAGTAKQIADSLFHILADLLDPHLRDDAEEERLDTLNRALDRTRMFVAQINTQPDQTIAHRRHVAIIHSLDHLTRLYVRCKNSEPLRVRRGDARLQRLARVVEGAVIKVRAEGLTETSEALMDRVRDLMRAQRRSYRQGVITRASQGHMVPDQAVARLDSIRWLHRSAYHVWRIVHHLRQTEDMPVTTGEPEPPVADVGDDA
jgi:phosphate:Na+ symporter